MDIFYLGFFKAFDRVPPQPPSRDTDMLQSRQVVSMVVMELADRPYPQRGGKWLLFKPSTCHKSGPSGINIRPNIV